MEIFEEVRIWLAKNYQWAFSGMLWDLGKSISQQIIVFFTKSKKISSNTVFLGNPSHSMSFQEQGFQTVTTNISVSPGENTEIKVEYLKINSSIEKITISCTDCIVNIQTKNS